MLSDSRQQILFFCKLPSQREWEIVTAGFAFLM